MKLIFTSRPLASRSNSRVPFYMATVGEVQLDTCPQQPNFHPTASDLCYKPVSAKKTNRFACCIFSFKPVLLISDGHCGEIYEHGESHPGWPDTTPFNKQVKGLTSICKSMHHDNLCLFFQCWTNRMNKTRGLRMVRETSNSRFI